MGRSGVLCAGTVVVDVAKVVDRFPTPELLAVIESVTPSTGGPALNLAVDLARLGADYPLGIVGVVGQDEYAGFVLAELDRLGIDTTRLRRTGSAATSFTDAMILRGSGVRSFYHHIGANALLTAADVDVASSSARVLHMGAPGLHDAMDAAGGWAAVLAAAQRAGMHTNLELVSLEPDRMREVALPCLPHLDSLIVNEVEAASVAGIELAATSADGVTDWSAMEDVARRVLGLGVKSFVAVHFPAGCVAVTHDGGVHRQGSVDLPADQVISAVGAGDAFASGVIHGVHEGWPLQDSLRTGVCIAAACLGGSGTSDGVRPLSECLALGAEFGYRPHAT
jgi:sugar/nucleoside kinase (ribokinase family)